MYFRLIPEIFHICPSIVPFILNLVRSKVKTIDAKIAKMLKSFFGNISAANAPIYIK